MTERINERRNDLMNERPTLGCLRGCGERAGEEDAKSSPSLQVPPDLPLGL